MHNSDRTAALKLVEHGAQLYRRAVLEDLSSLHALFSALPTDHAGIRINGLETLRPHLRATGSIGAIAADVLGPASRPVRAILFDKTAETNWSLAWHQDRTICVRKKVDTQGFGPWTMKAAMQHVAPPFDLLSRMVTLRVHLDNVPATNAPLLIAPGSHTCGRILVGEVEEVVQRCGTEVCTAEAGDAWLYATPILHASEAAEKPTHRRVLQLDFAAEDLPNGLEWLGV